MARLIDSLGLFGDEECGATECEITCGYCQTTYNLRTTSDDVDAETICYSEFGDLEICECCFDAMEEAVLNNLDRIVIWLSDCHTERQAKLDNDQELLSKLKIVASKL